MRCLVCRQMISSEQAAINHAVGCHKLENTCYRPAGKEAQSSNKRVISDGISDEVHGGKTQKTGELM